jgi:hypothetical protein
MVLNADTGVHGACLPARQRDMSNGLAPRAVFIQSAAPMLQ